MAKKPVLLQIDKAQEKGRETERDFLFQLQRALLLALKEEGILSEEQLHYAGERLDKQRSLHKQRSSGR